MFQFSYQDALVSDQELAYFGKELMPEIERLQQAVRKEYETPYAFVNVPFDTATRDAVLKVVSAKKALNISSLVVIGIGGSNLGALAVHEALHGKLYNELTTGIKVYWADTIDPEQLQQQLQRVEQELAAGKRVLLNVVTKSGKTTETIVNFELFLNLLRKHRPNDYQQYVVVTTDAGSAFEAFSVDQGFTTLTIPVLVGGRYSVCTPVGLFPLALLGVDIEAFLVGAQESVPSSTDAVLFNNSAAMSALIKYLYYQQCVTIHDLFVAGPNLASFGYWYRQLLAESIGKELNKSSQRVEVGITPTVSVGTIDLHSVAQLALGGPRDKSTTFLIARRAQPALSVPRMPEFEPLVAHIQGVPVADIMEAISTGVQEAYRANKRPFCTITLPDLSARSLGQLMQWCMIEMVYLGHLFDVNPFDQPNVEAYKRETRRILEEG